MMVIMLNDAIEIFLVKRQSECDAALATATVLLAMRHL
jgi:hypothetical protein